MRHVRISLQDHGMHAAVASCQFWPVGYVWTSPMQRRACCAGAQENDVEREFQIHRTEEDYAYAEFWRWALAFLIGVAMGCIGFVVDWGIEALNNFKFYHTVNTIATRGARQA